MKAPNENHESRVAMERLRSNIARLDHSPSVLLVDDSERDLEMMKRALMAFSNTMMIVTAKDMDEALLALTSVPFDLVFLDLIFPTGPTGVDILKRIKEASSVPVLVLTGAHNHDPRISEAIAEGATGVFPKPLRKEQLSLIFGTP